MSKCSADFPDFEDWAKGKQGKRLILRDKWRHAKHIYDKEQRIERLEASIRKLEEMRKAA